MLEVCDIVTTSPVSDVRRRHNKPHVAGDDDDMTELYNTLLLYFHSPCCLFYFLVYWY